MKKTKFFLFALSLTFLFSCRKSDLPTDPKLLVNKSMGTKQQSFKKQDMVEWLDAHKVNLSSKETETLNLLNKNLDYSNLKIESRNNGDNIIIIPLNNVVKEYLKLDGNSVLNLMIIQSSTGKFRWSSIVSYLPSDGNRLDRLPDGTLQSIMNTTDVKTSGMYKFIGLKGRLSYQLEYKNGKVHSFGRVVKKDQLPQKFQSLAKSNGNTTSGSEHCTAYYLITTTYYSDGTSETTSEYLFTLCDGDDPTIGGGGGGGGGGNDQPEEENDQEVTVHGHFTEEFFDYEQDDYTSDDNMGISPTDQFNSPVEGGLSAGSPSRVVLVFDYDHRFKSILGVHLIEYIYMFDVTAFPVNETYFNSQKGWITRNIVPITIGKDPNVNGDGTASLTWDYEVNWRYSYLNRANSTFSRQTAGSKTKVIFL